MATSDVLKALLPSNNDYLRVSTNRDLIRFLEKNNKTKILESVEFSDSTLKINKRGKEQERDLIITNLAVYNFIPRKYTKAQRIIPIVRLRGVALSRHSDELLFQVRNEYDYRFRVVRRAEVLEVVNKFSEKMTNQKLKVTFSDNLDTIQVTKNDLKNARNNESEDSRSSDVCSTLSTGHSSVLAQPTNHHDSDQSDNEEEQPVEGWLTKKGHTNTIWRRRFFRLGNANMRYYEARTKGSCILTEGLARPWKNYRYSVMVHEASVPSTPRHLEEIFAHAERRDAFLEFAKKIYNNENAEFCVGVQRYRLESDERRLGVARTLVDAHLRSGASKEISTPQQSRIDAVTAVEKGTVTPETFDHIYRIVMAYMRVTLLPQYLSAAKKEMSSADYRIRKDLTDEQKKQEQCSGCCARFSLINVRRRRTLCQYCNIVFCSTCVSKQTQLQPPFEDDRVVSVCDVCYGILNPNSHVNQKTEYAFTYASPQRAKPMNLAAESYHERDMWINAISSARLRHEHVGEINKNMQKKKEPQIHVEGWLWKEDPTTKSWRRRYFVLTDDRLWYYEMSLKGSIPLTQGLGVYATNDMTATLAPHEASFGGFLSNTNFAYRFNITDNDRIYHVAADSKDMQHYWIDALQHSLKTNAEQKPAEEKMDDIFSESYHQSAPEGSVTFVFTDVQSSTKLWENAPDGMNNALELHDDLLRTLLKRCRGYEVKTEGDAFMVTFFNIIDAVKWCILVQRELLKLEWPKELITEKAAAIEYDEERDPKHEKAPIFAGIRIRMGVHVGKVSSRRNPITGRMDYFGQVVNRTARVSDSAHGGQIVCTQEVYKPLMEAIDNDKLKDFDMIVDELGEFSYKGISEPVLVYQITPTELKARNPFPPLRLHK